MNHHVKRILCLTLCAIMLCALLPGITVKAAELQPDEYGSYHITSFAQLKELCKKTYDLWTNVLLDNASELVISENLTVPENLSLQFFEHTVTIPEGVTLTTNSYLDIDTMNVAGTWVCNESYNIHTKLNITGTLQQNSNGYLDKGTEVIGKDKITFTHSDHVMTTQYYLQSNNSAVADILSVKALAEAVPNFHWAYSVYLVGTGNLILDKDLSLPQNMKLYISTTGTTTVGKDTTLSLAGYCNIDAPVVIEGTLINNGGICIDTNGTLTRAASGTYQGNCFISSYQIESPEDALFGFNMSDFEITVDDWGWEAVYVGNLTQQPKPTGLEWGYSYQWFWNSNTQQSELIKQALPGSVSWTCDGQSDYYVTICKEDGTVVLDGMQVSYSDSGISFEEFASSDQDSGKYYFTVTTLGDHETTRDSEPAVSDFFTYTKPADKLATPTNLGWRWPSPTYTPPANQTHVGGYAVEYFFRATESEEPVSIHREQNYNANNMDSFFWLWNDIVREHGAGYYSFRIRSLSSDINAVCNSDWSAMSPAYHSEVDYINPFVDVNMSEYYGDAVLWAMDYGITTGTSDTTFAPNDTCTRGQIVTFLWRAAGCPVPGNMSNPFVDVTENDYYYNAVLWAVSAGITNGLSDTTFGPGEACTRGQVATFLWRAQNKPAYSGENIFTDLEPGAYYYDAVLWAVENKITNGMGDGLFAPHSICTRGQIVTFLYRTLN